jgi:hypothetical protein
MDQVAVGFSLLGFRTDTAVRVKFDLETESKAPADFLWVPLPLEVQRLDRGSVLFW